eukprot:scaffold125740_cov50-Attheya_sp.AAC.1
MKYIILGIRSKNEKKCYSTAVIDSHIGNLVVSIMSFMRRSSLSSFLLPMKCTIPFKSTSKRQVTVPVFKMVWLASDGRRGVPKWVEIKFFMAKRQSASSHERMGVNATMAA